MQLFSLSQQVDIRFNKKTTRIRTKFSYMSNLTTFYFLLVRWLVDSTLAGVAARARTRSTTGTRWSARPGGRSQSGTSSRSNILRGGWEAGKKHATRNEHPSTLCSRRKFVLSSCLVLLHLLNCQASFPHCDDRNTFRLFLWLKFGQRILRPPYSSNTQRQHLEKKEISKKSCHLKLR